MLGTESDTCLNRGTWPWNKPAAFTEGKKRLLVLSGKQCVLGRKCKTLLYSVFKLDNMTLTLVPLCTVQKLCVGPMAWTKAIQMNTQESLGLLQMQGNVVGGGKARQSFLRMWKIVNNNNNKQIHRDNGILAHWNYVFLFSSHIPKTCTVGGDWTL